LTNYYLLWQIDFLLKHEVWLKSPEDLEKVLNFVIDDLKIHFLHLKNVFGDYMDGKGHIIRNHDKMKKALEECWIIKNDIITIINKKEQKNKSDDIKDSLKGFEEYEHIFMKYFKESVQNHEYWTGHCDKMEKMYKKDYKARGTLEDINMSSIIESNKNLAKEIMSLTNSDNYNKNRLEELAKKFHDNYDSFIKKF